MVTLETLNKFLELKTSGVNVLNTLHEMTWHRDYRNWIDLEVFCQGIGKPIETRRIRLPFGEEIWDGVVEDMDSYAHSAYHKTHGCPDCYCGGAPDFYGLFELDPECETCEGVGIEI